MEVHFNGGKQNPQLGLISFTLLSIAIKHSY